MTEPPFPRICAGTFSWPFRHRVRVAILALVPLGAAFLATFPARGWRGRAGELAGRVLLVACAVSYLFAVLRRTTDPHAPSPETLAREVDLEDVPFDLLGFLGAMAVAYLPLAGLLVHAFVFTDRPLESTAAKAAAGIAGAAGTLYFPMALLMMGVGGDWRAGFNLPLGIRTIGRLGGDYLYCAGAFLATAAMIVLMEVVLVPSTAPRTWDRFLARAGAGAAEFYLAVVSMRILGLLYVARHGRLGWAARDA